MDQTRNTLDPARPARLGERATFYLPGGKLQVTIPGASGLSCLGSVTAHDVEILRVRDAIVDGRAETIVFRERVPRLADLAGISAVLAALEAHRSGRPDRARELAAGLPEAWEHLGVLLREEG